MAQMTSEEALNGIFNILETMINQQAEQQKKKENNETDDNIKKLINGLLEVKNPEDINIAATQIEKLVLGLKELADIDTGAIDRISASVELLNTSLSNIIHLANRLSNSQEINMKENLNNLFNNFILDNPQLILNSLQSINQLILILNTVVNLKTDGINDKLNSLTDIVSTFGKLIEKIDNDLREVNIPTNLLETVLTISLLFNSIIAIADKSIYKIIYKFNPITSKLLAMSISTFISTIAKEIDGKKVDESIKYIALLLLPLILLADPNNKFSVYNVKKKLTKLLAKDVATFFIVLLEELNNIDTKNLSKVSNSIVNFLNALIKLDFDPKKISELLNKEFATNIAGFFTTLQTELNKIDENALSKNVKSVSIILESLSKHLIKSALSLKIASFLLNKKDAENVVAYISTICSAKVDPKKLKATKEFIEGFGKILLILTGVLAVLVLLITFAPIESLIGGIVIVGVTITFMKHIITDLVNNITGDDVKTASLLINDLGKILTLTVISIAIIAAITAIFGIVPVITGLVIVGLALAGGILIIKYLSNTEIAKNTPKALESTKSLTYLLLGISISIAILAFVSHMTTVEDMLLAASILFVVGGGMVGIVIILNRLIKGDGKNLENAITALTKLTAITLVLSLMALFIFPKLVEQASPILGGLFITFAILLVMIGGVALLSKISKDNLHTATISLAILTAIMLGVSLIALFIFPNLAKNAANIAIGAVITLLIIASMVGIVALLGLIEQEKLNLTVTTLVILTAIMLGVSLIALFIFPKLADNVKDIRIGAVIVIVIIGILSLITWGLSKIDNENLIKSVTTVVILTAITLAVSLIALFLFKPIGSDTNFKDILVGGGIVIGTVALIGALAIGLGYLVKVVPKSILIEGVKSLLIITGLLWLLSKALDPFIDVINKVNTFTFGKLMTGIGLIILILGCITVIVAALGALVTFSGDIALVIAGSGVVLLAILWLSIWIINKTVEEYIDIIELTNKITTELIETSADKILNLLYGVGKIIGTLALIGAENLLTLPLLVVSGLILFGTFKLISYLIDTILNINKSINTNDVDQFNNLVWKDPNRSIISSIFGILSSFISLKSFGAIIGAVVGAIISTIMLPIMKLLTLFVSLVSSVAKGTYIIGYDSNGNPKYEHLNPEDFNKAGEYIVTNFKNFLSSFADGTVILGSIAGVIISTLSRFMQPLILLVGEFVDIIMKVATGTYLIGYDDNGKPKYEHLNPADFALAGILVTENFKEFLKALDEGFTVSLLLKSDAIGIMSEVMQPVINLISGFVDVVMKVATGTYITGYDENGKPEYTHITDLEFSKAGIAVTDRFKDFLIKLNEGFSAMSITAIYAMNQMKDVMLPVVEMVSMFIDAIIKVVSTLIITGYDKNGKPEYEQIDINEFGNAGTIISARFGEFIKQLNDNLSGLDEIKLDALEVLSDTMSPIMDSVSKFVDAIIKFASGQYIDGYTADKNGNMTIPHFTKIERDDMENAAISIAQNFGTFIDAIVKVFDQHEGKAQGWFGTHNSTEDALKAIGSTMQPIMENIGGWVEAILMLAGGTYIKEYKEDKNGKAYPVYEKLPENAFATAAGTLAGTFSAFIDILVNNFSSANFKAKAELILEIINGSISPIMEAFKSFSDALMPFFGIKTGDKDNELMLVLMDGTNNKSKIENIAENIASTYTSFIGTIITYLNLNKNNLEGLNSAAEEVNKLMKPIKNTFDSLNKIYKLFKNTLEEGEGNTTSLLQLMTDIAIMLVGTGVYRTDGVIRIFARFFNAYDSKYFDAANESATSCNNFIKIISKISKSLSDIIDNITLNENYETLIHNFNNLLLSICDELNNIAIKAKTVSTYDIIAVLNSYSNIVSKYNEISETLSNIDFTLFTSMGDSLIKLILLLKTINEEMENTNLYKGITNFKYSLRELVETYSELSVLIPMMQKFNNNLLTFSGTIISTTRTLSVYITTLEKATRALKALDNQIINEAQKREAALQRFNDKINNIAEAFKKMTKTFEELDQNAVLNRFDALNKLLELAGISTGREENAENTSTNNNSNNNQNNTNNYNYNGYGYRTGNITVQFANHVLDGTYTAN